VVLAGVAFAAWSLVDLLGLESWQAVLAAIVLGSALLVVVALVTPDGLGVVIGLWDATRPRTPDAELLERLCAQSIHDVRRRAEEFERRAAALQAGSSATDRELASMYSAPGRLWRRLERSMREAGAFHVADLPEGDVQRWGRRLGLWRDGLSWDPLIPQEAAEALTRDVRLPRPTATRGRLVLRRWPGPRGGVGGIGESPRR
jgi:hypothetical protein